MNMNVSFKNATPVVSDMDDILRQLMEPGPNVPTMEDIRAAAATGFTGMNVSVARIAQERIDSPHSRWDMTEKELIEHGFGCGTFGYINIYEKVDEGLYYLRGLDKGYVVRVV